MVRAYVLPEHGTPAVPRGSFPGAIIPRVEDGAKQRVASNEAIFRDVNEALRRGHWPGEEGSPVAFRCECGQLGCSRMIEVNVADYERVRAHPRHFLMAPDHDIPATETVIEAHGPYVVVEKRGDAGRVAEATDPRS